jgi:hypothetical protein
VRPFLAWVVALVLASDLAVVGVRTAGSQTHVHVRVRPGGPPRTVVVPPPGQARVNGVVTGLSSEAEVVDAIPTPFTVNVAARGEGGATISAAMVNGRRVFIVWDSGTPLPVTGGPATALDPSPAHVTVDPGGMTVDLDGAPRAFAPGAYATTAPVAVGSGGLASPQSGVRFTADAQTALTTSGGGRVRVSPRPVRLDGPGTVTASGRLQVVTAVGTATVGHIVFGPGPFTIELRPAAGGWDITATLQGPLKVE